MRLLRMASHVRWSGIFFSSGSCSTGVVWTSVLPFVPLPRNSNLTYNVAMASRQAVSTTQSADAAPTLC